MCVVFWLVRLRMVMSVCIVCGKNGRCRNCFNECCSECCNECNVYCSMKVLYFSSFSLWVSSMKLVSIIMNIVSVKLKL